MHGKGEKNNKIKPFYSKTVAFSTALGSGGDVKSGLKKFKRKVKK